jgi:hypothetical protein
LRKRSDTRIAIDRDFGYLREEIERYKKLVAEKSVSLNEAQRLKEKQEADERTKARKKELAARPEPPGKVYEITLKQVDEPGLPAPVSKTNHTTKASSNGFFRINGKDNQTASAEGTNNQVAKSDASTDDPDEISEDKTPVDITLEETKRILMDLVYLSMQQNPGVNTTRAR